MNWEQVEGKWKQYSGKVQEKWGKLTDSDLQVIKGKRDQLVGKIQERIPCLKRRRPRSGAIGLAARAAKRMIERTEAWYSGRFRLSKKRTRDHRG